MLASQLSAESSRHPPTVALSYEVPVEPHAVGLWAQVPVDQLIYTVPVWPWSQPPGLFSTVWSNHHVTSELCSLTQKGVTDASFPCSGSWWKVNVNIYRTSVSFIILMQLCSGKRCSLKESLSSSPPCRIYILPSYISVRTGVYLALLPFFCLHFLTSCGKERAPILFQDSRLTLTQRPSLHLHCGLFWLR